MEEEKRKTNVHLWHDMKKIAKEKEKWREIIEEIVEENNVRW